MTDPLASSSRLTSEAPPSPPPTIAPERATRRAEEVNMGLEANIPAKQQRIKKSYHHLKSNKVLGTTILPVTRVTRAAKQDKDIKIVSKEAVFLISIATEFFIRKLTDSAFEHAKIEKRVFVKYNDIEYLSRSAKAVQSNEEYNWLQEVIPVSRPLGSILNDPSIPTASTAITNELPGPIKERNLSDPLSPSNDNLNEITQSNLIDEQMEVDEDELDEDCDTNLTS